MFSTNRQPKTELSDRLQQLQQRIPLVSDKALVDLVNGIDINKDLIRYRKSRGYFGQLFDSLTGSDRQRQLLLDGNLIAGQEALYNWVLELTDSLSISQVALKVTQQSLLEARSAIRRQKQAILSLSEHLENSINAINRRLNELENRIYQLEIRIAASEDLDRILTAWMAEQTYTNLPWAIQIALLTREIFSSSVAIYEQVTGDTKRFRPLVVNKILAHSQPPSKQFFGLANLLNQTCKEISAGDRELTAALLEVRSLPFSRLQTTPLLFTLGTTLELAILPPDAQPKQIGKCAVALCRQQIDRISQTTDAREFVTAVVEEIANDYVNLIR
ncbi:diguanylate cyclase regulator RdcB family protein [Capilliphycus salinus ALCB114379]|uniref:diguanylate cyclase regulator RdcB family protein n=1 Tax=Capilliphycus salinus TaxID=2768948 RepID=UPI0039A64278